MSGGLADWSPSPIVSPRAPEGGDETLHDQIGGNCQIDGLDALTEIGCNDWNRS